MGNGVGAQVLVADRYLLETPIGRGGMGEVWRAADQVLGRPVAVKLLLGSEVDASATARFRLEAQTAARLSHPHVVAVFDFGAWQDRFYLVMELVEGVSLAQVLASEAQGLRTERVAQVAAQAAAGLAAAHRQGIVHRDIKPGNLMLDAEGAVKIGDFGIARFVDDPSGALTTAGQIVGTSLYLAPERALGQPAGPASDMYSLGCVLYQLLVGRPPFRSDTATGTLYQHVDAAPVPPSRLVAGVAPAFEAYLLSLLAKQPEARPTADQAASWFRTDAWTGGTGAGAGAVAPQSGPVRGPATALPRQPLPGQGPHGVPPGATRPPARPGPGPVQSAAPTGTPGSTPASGALPLPPLSPVGPVGPAREADSATVYRLPAGGRGRRGKQSSARTLVRRRPRFVSAIGGVVAFVVAVLVGMALFSPDTSTAGTPEPTIATETDEE
ncbi:protein kinase [Streptomyces sp. NPDC051907]|uniref:serine/threonine-protein kinase n=1 Tax=Streptomyces sp. NPDC051907 TaxID=3155284 RepID=UPI00342C97B9